MVRGGGGFDPFSRQPEGKIAINIVVRRGGEFDSGRQVESRILINVLVSKVAGLIPPEGDSK